MIYEEKYVKRLLKLANHLSSGRLYGQYLPMTPPPGKTEKDAPILEYGEETLIGYFPMVVDELPYLYPRIWRFNDLGEPVLIRNPQLDSIDAFKKFMGVKEYEFVHIAVPCSQSWRSILGGEYLCYHATPMDVAHQIFELLGVHLRMN